MCQSKTKHVNLTRWGTRMGSICRRGVASTEKKILSNLVGKYRNVSSEHPAWLRATPPPVKQKGMWRKVMRPVSTLWSYVRSSEHGHVRGTRMGSICRRGVASTEKKNTQQLGRQVPERLKRAPGVANGNPPPVKQKGMWRKVMRPVPTPVWSYVRSSEHGHVRM